MRVLGVDFGQRRIGLALSDATGTLARPWKAIAAAGTPQASADVLTRLITDAHASSDDALEDLTTIVVGVPKRLNGEETQQTRPAREFVSRLQQTLPQIRVVEQDERLTSHEADRLLAEREPDWRRRKEKLDAAAAALLLQDYLDQRRRADASQVDDAQQTDPYEDEIE
jgi:putative Holliday junction resolvase